jgi:hypothetical protein
MKSKLGFKVGDRVNEIYLGKGTIERVDVAMKGLHLVKFDKTPDVRYNMGENPTAVFDYKLIHIKD